MFILWVRYWLIYAAQSMCLPGLVNICICLFNQKWLGTPDVAHIYIPNSPSIVYYLPAGSSPGCSTVVLTTEATVGAVYISYSTR